MKKLKLRSRNAKSIHFEASPVKIGTWIDEFLRQRVIPGSIFPSEHGLRNGTMGDTEGHAAGFGLHQRDSLARRHARTGLLTAAFSRHCPVTAASTRLPATMTAAVAQAGSTLSWKSRCAIALFYAI